MKKDIRSWLKDVLGITFGGLIFAFGLNYFIIANHLAEGGLTGVALTLHYLFGWPVGSTYLIMNIPLFAIGWRVLGTEFALKTVLGTVVASIGVDLTHAFQSPMPGDLLLASLYGGSAIGLGLGVIFLFGGSTGGGDIVARLVNHRWGLPMGRVLFMVDVVVITSVGFIFGQSVAMYTLVAVFVASRIIDFVQEGAYTARAAMIISEKSPEIAQRVLEELERGATVFNARGVYTDAEKNVLYCVVSRSELVRLKSLVYEIDPRAFMIINEVHEVLGEGFRNWHST
ncbi:DUF2179 domain-containing protein [Heliobacterium gestii]|uniref:DUF2179 domain-containing protein n=1 Tax=Heliomicrobium gestii TaxID=2699 RepID=A0A845L5V8_HELGE|nr:YitT family protein [Heliomicrobium gestii]MBM7865327.1 uncharacterized membrane-anchored protein YitT (DUF2179 family) [Heliomicrobium gestii]MZP41588.1 DUF2179 domain-containing protein [Heliomicrobium gestii]